MLLSDLLCLHRVTNSDGRADLLRQDQFAVGVYKITFETSLYFSKTNTKTFYPYAEVR